MTRGLTQTKGRACGTKRRYRDEAAAGATRQRLIDQGAAPDRLNVYQCKHCSGWHVGHLPKERRAR